MTIISEILQTIKTSHLDEQVKIICNQIMEEERPKFKNPEQEPKGSNIILAIEFDSKVEKEISYLCLEREFVEKYLVSIWVGKLNFTNYTFKRKKIWEVNESTAEKIIKFYAEILKYLRGE